MAAASSTGLPEMRSVTSRTLRGLMRMYLAVALTCIDPLLQRRRALGGPATVPAVCARRRELAEPMPDHVLGDEDGHVTTAVVDGDRVPDHLREDHACPRPGLQHLALAALVHVVDAAEQARVDEWSLLDGTTHLSAPQPRPYRRRTISLLLLFFLTRVRRPMAGLPHLVFGGMPVGCLPSPPPCGWSFGFIAEPRTVGRLPMWRARPALPIFWFSWSRLLTCPTVAMHSTRTRRTSPDGSRMVAKLPSLASSCALLPAERTIWPPRPATSSMLWICVPSGMRDIGRALPGRASTSGPEATVSPTPRPCGRSM